jgi:predicted RNase H-like nuclease (RuvC/YqgF family)
MTDKSVEVIAPGSAQSLHGVQNRPNYRRDPYSKALFVVDEKALKEYNEKKLERRKLNSAEERITELEDNIKEMKDDVKEMKSVLSSLINILSKNKD